MSGMLWPIKDKFGGQLIFERDFKGKFNMPASKPASQIAATT